MSYYSASFEDYDHRKINVSWSENLWTEHVKKHPELTDFKATSYFIESAVSSPDVVMQGKRDGETEMTLCYYKQVSRDRGFIKYIKVVVGCNSRPYYVKSVFCKQAPIQYVIQENKYSQFKRIWSNPNSYI